MTMRLRALRAKQMQEGLPGEPCVLLPTKKIGVMKRDGKHELTITLADLIDYIEELEGLK